VNSDILIGKCAEAKDSLLDGFSFFACSVDVGAAIGAAFSGDHPDSLPASGTVLTSFRRDLQGECSAEKAITLSACGVTHSHVGAHCWRGASDWAFFGRQRRGW
jgi:hypothetical protein